MIGHPINWKELAFLNKCQSTHAMIKRLRNEEGLTYTQIARKLGVSESALYNKCMDLVDKGKLTLQDLKRGKNNA